MELRPQPLSRQQEPPPPPPVPPPQQRQQQRRPIPNPLQRIPSIPSTLLNKYRMGKLLGRGSFAKVFAAFSIADGKQVAIKIIDKTKTESFMEPKIICEIKAMHRLQHHPNILRILEVMATRTRIFIVMELAVGGDLFSKVVQRGRMKESGARRYFQQLVSALHFCHENGVAHRDVKPQNLLLDSDGNLKVSDFGLSALAEAAEAKNGVNGILHTACGTPAFTAPEVLYRKGYDGEKADAWSCGVILFFLLSASLPFDDSNLAVMYKKIHKKQYQIPSWVSKPARWIVHQLLDPNPQTRMSIETLMNHSWFMNKYQTPAQRSVFESEEYSKSRKFNSTTVSSFNAFDIISMSSGLDLSGLFEATCRKEKRFTSRERIGRVMERVRDVGKKLEYVVEEGKGGGAIGLAKGKLVLVVEAMEIAEKMVVADVRVAKGCGVEFEQVHLVDLKKGLGDVVLEWHGDAVAVAVASLL
ncbi:CBL-interacting serine/threonine-protein kinase 7 [Linum perenne]